MCCSRLFVLVFALLFVYTTQQGDDLDDLIGQVFPNPNADNRNEEDFNLQPGPPVTPVPGTGSCRCVPYYLCNDTKIITDGFGLIDIRIEDGPCPSYLENCCIPPDLVDTPLTPRPVDNKPTGCGRHNPNGVGFRITGNKDNEAQFGEFPWMVAVLREESVEGHSDVLNVYQCGGSLIHRQAVITAAHCVNDKNKKFKIRAGEWDTQTKKELFPHQDRDVKSIIIHPQFYSGALHNDIAILILDSPFDLEENVDVVCLPSQNEVIDNTRCFASGWGKDTFGKEGKYQVILKKIDLPIVNWATCQKAMRTTRLGAFFNLHDSFICAGGEPGKDTCKGDGGSPLVCPIEGQEQKYQQAGIVAWGIGCGENAIPGVYANVAKFITWIDQQMMANNLETSVYKY